MSTVVLRASDVRQWLFCRRVLFHRLVTPHLVRESPKMRLGRSAEAALAKLERRRVAKKYGLDRAERHFGVGLSSDRLGVDGICDLVLEAASPDGPPRLVPVEIKQTQGGVSRHHLAQLAGYALMLEEQRGLEPGAIDIGFVLLLPVDDLVQVKLGDAPRADFVRALDEIREMLRTERFPAPTVHRSFCPQCEYVNFCGDVL